MLFLNSSETQDFVIRNTSCKASEMKKKTTTMHEQKGKRGIVVSH